MNTEQNSDNSKKALRIGSVVSSAEVPAVRVRNYNEETGETEDGTVIDDATLNTYLVIPDYNLQMTVRWNKMNCDVLR
jgi:penicillin V acylase-like amidase (Ntn superfamily)